MGLSWGRVYNLLDMFRMYMFKLHLLHTLNSFCPFHRMAAPDSPWMSGGWRPALSPKYQDLWAHGYSHPGLRSTSE